MQTTNGQRQRRDNIQEMVLQDLTCMYADVYKLHILTGVW